MIACLNEVITAAYRAELQADHPGLGRRKCITILSTKTDLLYIHLFRYLRRSLNYGLDYY